MPAIEFVTCLIWPKFTRQEDGIGQVMATEQTMPTTPEQHSPGHQEAKENTEEQ